MQYLELFTTTTTATIINGSSVMSVHLSMHSKLILEEPLSVASVITFGIEGDCILEELVFNASIDDIYGKNIYVCIYTLCDYHLITYIHTGR